MRASEEYALRMADLARAVVGSGPLGPSENR